uniref:WD repeat domain 74 n=1 Tax=Rousettus aegyptiacus TaxID=9407 RepID=A0A7J8HAB5_ROUAE|nr:WD repeat domain 74 [Rousettus aegyptiacus]
MELPTTLSPVYPPHQVRNDWLDLRVPIWDQDIQFLPESQKLVTCTGYHQVRVYDPASPQRRPVLEATYGEYPLTAMTLTPGANSVIVGNTHGQLADELWASLEAAAKRKLPDFELTPGSLPTRRRKKRPGSASP